MQLRRASRQGSACGLKLSVVEPSGFLGELLYIAQKFCTRVSFACQTIVMRLTFKVHLEFTIMLTSMAMKNLTKIILSLAVLVLSLGYASEVRADPVVITSGFVLIGGPPPPPA